MTHPRYKIARLRAYLVQVHRVLTLVLPKRRGLWSNQKVSTPKLVAAYLTMLHFKHPHFSTWWVLLKEFYPHWCSFTQAYLRLHKALETLEGVACRTGVYALLVCDSAPLPVCRLKRTKRCKVREACLGYSTQGWVYGFKVHAWVTLEGEIVQYRLETASLHDTPAAEQLNVRWAEYGGPRVLGDKGYVGTTYITPSKQNAKSPDPRNRPEYGRQRKRVETVFSQLIAEHIRVGQVKSLCSLRLKVTLAVLAHNLNFWLVNP
jgi:hypothetical protein